METHGPGFSPEQLASGEYLNYIIRFQNTGTDTAFRVLVRDTLSSKLNLSTLEMISASSAYSLSVHENKLEWKFDPIILPDSNHNEAASHGYIAYRIKPISNLQLGDTISNKAAIYFDFNLPVITNDHHTIIKTEPGICPGGSIVFNAGITGSNYQWQVNTGSGYSNILNGGSYSGVATPNLLISSASSSWYGYKYRCLVNGELASQEMSLKFEVKWTGTKSTGWEDSSNWDCGVMPNDKTDVIISNGVSNYPQVNSNVSVRSLRISSGASVIVKAGMQITVSR